MKLTPQQFIKNLQQQSAAVRKYMEQDAPRMAGVEAVNHFKQAFIDGGFTDSSFSPWQTAKRTDNSSRWYGFQYCARTPPPNSHPRRAELKNLTIHVKQTPSQISAPPQQNGTESISIDYTPPLGDEMGFTSLELLLLSLSSYLGSSVLVFLRRMQKTISGFSINAKGIRREEHPTCFSKIFLDIKLQSPDLTQAELDKVLKLSEQT